MIYFVHVYVLIMSPCLSSILFFLSPFPNEKNSIYNKQYFSPSPLPPTNKQTNKKNPHKLLCILPVQYSFRRSFQKRNRWLGQWVKCIYNFSRTCPNASKIVVPTCTLPSKSRILQARIKTSLSLLNFYLA